MWISVNATAERPEIINAAMALSGRYDPEDYDMPFCEDLSPLVVASLYNNADSLGLDIYQVKGHEESEC